jgi:hypothetical protein
VLAGLAFQLGRGLGLELVEQRPDRRRFEGSDVCSNGVRPQVAEQHPERGEVARGRRIIVRATPSARAARRAVTAPLNATNEVAGVVTAAQRDEPERVRHRRDDARSEGRPAAVAASTPMRPPSRQAPREPRRCRGGIAPPRKYSGSSCPATRFASVSVGSLAAAVAPDGPALALRGPTEAARLVHPGDRAAAGADLDDLDDRA